MSQAQAYKPAHGGFPGLANIRNEEAAARAVAGGLQAHSIGGLYPLHIVAIDNSGKGEGRHYELHNLQTGQAACLSYRRDGNIPRTWAGHAGGYDMAHAFAEAVIAGKRSTEWA